MCRYAYFRYKQHLACFDCRKAFKHQDARPVDEPGRLRTYEFRQVPCPECRRPMVAMGFDFKAPRRSDREQWRKVRLLSDHGIRFSSCGCTGPGPRPRSLAEVVPFLKARPPRSPGEALLRKFDRRRSRPS